jgi:hypothetical protein
VVKIIVDVELEVHPQSSLDCLLNQLNLVQNIRNAFLQDESKFVTVKQYFYMHCCVLCIFHLPVSEET